jgi:hypothetical protein
MNIKIVGMIPGGKKMRNKNTQLISVLLPLAFLLFSSACQEEPMGVADINNGLPVIKMISADNLTPAPGDTIEVSVQAENGSSFSWSASSGSFSDASTNPTSWYVPEDGQGVQRLTCEVKNSAGARHAAISISIFRVIVPEGVAGYWPFETDFNDYNEAGYGPNNGVGDELVSISDDAVAGIGSALFEGEDGADNGTMLAGGEDLDMGVEADFTITLWVKTEDENGFLIGKTFDGEYVNEGSKCIYLGEGGVICDLWGVGDAGWDEVYVSDGDWHNIAWIKEGTVITVYVDGEYAWDADFEEWRDDEDRVLTMGAGWEEPESDWPGALQGLIDDVRFYPVVLAEDDLVDIYEEFAP